MKTNVILKSKDRNLFGLIVRQQTKTMFLCVTDLQKAYNEARWQYGWSDRRIERVTVTNDFKERVYHLLFELKIIKTQISVFSEMVDNEGIIKALKGLKVWQTKGRGKDRAVYCNPYVWMLLAMEMNPLLYAKVIIWLTDSLILNRIFACDEYMPMNAAIKSIVPNPRYPEYAKAINRKVFGRHETGIRNKASSIELDNIARIERFVRDAISMGFIKTEYLVFDTIEKYQLINIAA